MTRSIDMCTCGKDRDSHGAYDVEQHNFFPHPQPNSAQRKTLPERLADFLTSNSAMLDAPVPIEDNARFRVFEDDGKLWEVTICLRKDPAASQEGV